MPSLLLVSKRGDQIIYGLIGGLVLGLIFGLSYDHTTAALLKLKSNGPEERKRRLCWFLATDG